MIQKSGKEKLLKKSSLRSPKNPSVLTSPHGFFPNGPRDLIVKYLIQWESSRGEIPLDLTSLKDFRDRSLAKELLQGVMRHRTYLDWRINHLSKKGVPPQSPLTLNALRIGFYQLLFLDRIPPHAAVNETVTLVKRCLGIKEANFANAILRSLQRTKKNPFDPKNHAPLESISISSSHPKWMVQRWMKQWGKIKTLQICQHNNQIPPVTLRVNTLKGTRESLRENLKKDGIQTRVSPFTHEALIFLKGEKLTQAPPFENGLFYIQDEGAQIISYLLNPSPEDCILDACAAPGGKTTHLAQLMKNKGEIIALDISLPRLSLLKENLVRLGVQNTEVLLRNSAKNLTSLGRNRFDGVLVDAPCSGLGVLRRYPEGKWKKGKGIIRQYASLQIKILENVAPLLKPGGRVLYCTCSTEKEENEDVVNQFLKTHRDFYLDKLPFSEYPELEIFQTPQGFISTHLNKWNMDFFFAATLRKMD